MIMTTNEFTSSWTEDGKEDLLGWWADSKVVVNPVLHSDFPFRFAKISRSEIHSETTETARSYISKIVPFLSLSLSLTHSLLFLSLSLSNTLQDVLYRVVLQIPYFTDFFSLFSSLVLRKLKLSLFLFKVDCFFFSVGKSECYTRHSWCLCAVGST